MPHSKRGMRSSPNTASRDNKGYGTPEHLAALERLGPTTLHRFSFEPVRNLSRYQPWTGYPIPPSKASCSHVPDAGVGLHS